jgi:hypothetical protein
MTVHPAGSTKPPLPELADADAVQRNHWYAYELAPVHVP